MSPILFPTILVMLGLFLFFSKNVPLGLSRVLRRPNTFFAGIGVALLGAILWFILAYIGTSKSAQLMWAMPIGYIFAILLMIAFSVREEDQVGISYEKSEIFSKSVILIFIILPSLILAIVFTLVMSPVAAIVLLILGIIGIVKFMKNNKK